MELAGEQAGVFSTPCSGLCSGLKATREGPVGLTRMLLSVFLNSARWKRVRPHVNGGLVRALSLPTWGPASVPSPAQLPTQALQRPGPEGSEDMEVTNLATSHGRSYSSKENARRATWAEGSTGGWGSLWDMDSQ